ncbi:ribonuclease P [Danaus plexippus plexippus]|uniref:Ribonuclease P n=2 Tax=Danaus plexippus TaxID=13037 RepID=A0A212F1F0_DANPL|nr:ribonuclease P [Danaus plexippus plexippus]
MEVAERPNWGFCDLCIDRGFDFKTLSSIKKLNYNTIAINTYVPEAEDEPKKKKKKAEQTKEKKDYIPAPPEIPADLQRNSKLNILQRVTIEFSESAIAHKIHQSENIKKYDIIAVLPRTSQAFQYICTTLDVDIITFDPQSRLPFRMSRKLYGQAVERGIFFELMYSPAIRDSTSRKNIITTAHTYHAVGRSKNIIVSSGAANFLQVRDVHDVINLGFILGLKSNESVQVIRNNTWKLILKAQSRRCGKYYVEVTQMELDENKTSD